MIHARVSAVPIAVADRARKPHSWKPRVSSMALRSKGEHSRSHGQRLYARPETLAIDVYRLDGLGVDRICMGPRMDILVLWVLLLDGFIYVQFIFYLLQHDCSSGGPTALV